MVKTLYLVNNILLFGDLDIAVEVFSLHQQDLRLQNTMLSQSLLRIQPISCNNDVSTY